MILSFSDVHCEISCGPGGFDMDFCRCTAELPEAFFECFRARTPFLMLVESLKGADEYIICVGEGIDLCLLAGEIQLSSGRGLRTGLEG